MAVNLETEPESAAGVSTLLSGIVQDARHLLVQQMTLFQVEIKNDINRAVAAMIPLIAGAIVAIPAMILIGIAAAEGLAIAAEIPLWLSFGIVGGGVGGVALVFIVWGALSLKSVHATPNVALNGLKENLQWKTKN
jgi:hypothetical protein